MSLTVDIIMHAESVAEIVWLNATGASKIYAGRFTDENVFKLVLLCLQIY